VFSLLAERYLRRLQGCDSDIDQPCQLLPIGPQYSRLLTSLKSWCFPERQDGMRMGRFFCFFFSTNAHSDLSRSGKSTQVPAFILEHELSQGRPVKVLCTEVCLLPVLPFGLHLPDSLASLAVYPPSRLLNEFPVSSESLPAPAARVLRLSDIPFGLSLVHR
jgi:hypothetical protein